MCMACILAWWDEVGWRGEEGGGREEGKEGRGGGREGGKGGESGKRIVSKSIITTT